MAFGEPVNGSVSIRLRRERATSVATDVKDVFQHAFAQVWMEMADTLEPTKADGGEGVPGSCGLEQFCLRMSAHRSNNSVWLDAHKIFWDIRDMRKTHGFDHVCLASTELGML